MDSKILIILAIILFIFIILNHVSVVVTPSSSSGEKDSISDEFGYIQTPSNCSNLPGCCSLTQYGCCPDGVNSRVDYLGSTCPKTYSQGYNPTSTILQNDVTPQTIFIPPQNIIKPLVV
jgi:hypothetical protein